LQQTVYFWRVATFVLQQFVIIRNCLFGLIALLKAARRWLKFIVSNERKSFASEKERESVGKKSYWNFSNCCVWRMRENYISLGCASGENVAAAKNLFDSRRATQSVFIILFKPKSQ